MNTPKIAILVSTVGVMLGACSGSPVTAPVAAQPPVAAPVAALPAPAPAQVPPAPAPAPTPAPQPVAASTVATVTLPAHLDPANPLSKERSVYFDFDDYVLKVEYANVLDRHGRYLASRPSLAIKIEGNADERGSAEYNLALGQRRAEVVLRALKIYGVKDTQMEAISWGEERPRASGHQEPAWSQNRRADLAYPVQ
jgi:peptidoglycan-associated lipoprotein